MRSELASFHARVNDLRWSIDRTTGDLTLLKLNWLAARKAIQGGDGGAAFEKMANGQPKRSQAFRNNRKCLHNPLLLDHPQYTQEEELYFSARCF